MNVGHEKKWETEEVREVLKVVSSEIPKLIENIIKTLKELLDEFYSPEKVRERADAFITFYKTLVENGIPEKEAIELAKKQLVDINMILERMFSTFGKYRHSE